ncbi:hypothetical protein HYH03_002516 [Edaphochlamys debaryana]|uniref:Uncharacterized protein n=1 Tax=Edaphochlamys debaryana TaxID=47281 RepID=A0A836C3X4_9CHLO|nr:hypothetical protein HYH03_002516 [Edaphochlamys debaryana]|eukprot:KAG2499571.1 hypothetical protein HYH03_002516 [Edaphochlamys debaryana]
MADQAMDFDLDYAREELFKLARSSERFASQLLGVVDELNKKKPEDEWLLQALEEGEKGVLFHEQQLALFSDFHHRANAYVEAVREEANQLAMLELQGKTPEAEEGDGEPGEGEEDSSRAPGTAARRKKVAKTVHPELLKFKLEKQAKILGKYGGVPALGAGLVLPRLQRESILKATGSPAAREIHYSKVEGKDAPGLAEVMRFKARKSQVDGDGLPGQETPAPSPWQAELTAKKGKSALDGTDAKDQVTPSTQSHAVYGEELGGMLRQRQAALEESMAAERAAAAAAASGGGAAQGPVISAEAQDELADKLRRRQTAAKQMEDEAAAAAAEAEAEAAPPVTPGWINAAAPFGGELAAALQKRAEAQRQTKAKEGADAPAGEGSSGRGGSGGGGGGPAATPGPAAPAGFVTPAQPARRSAPPHAMVGLATPAAGGGVSDELAEKLKRRLSAVDSQSPPPAPPAAADQELEAA